MTRIAIYTKHTENNLPKHSQKTKISLTISLIVILALLSNLTYTDENISTFTSGTPNNTYKTAWDENSLKTTINESNEPTTIALTSDITLTESILEISTNKDITLLSENTETFWSLIGTINNQTTINVYGKLTLDGIIVTHDSESTGSGVVVNPGGELVMNKGIISNNTAHHEGSGVLVIGGSFVMSGGMITNNTSPYYGGGVSVQSGLFTMFYDAVISNNTAKYGGGVYLNNASSSRMSGGIIANNSAVYVTGGNYYGSGGGVCNVNGNFSIGDDTVIANNTATNGGGVYSNGTVKICSGLITNNKALGNGGGVFANHSSFHLSGDAVVANNTANNDGGGVFVWSSVFFLDEEGIIANNTANQNGGGVYNQNSMFDMSDDAVIANNTATNGGGVYISNSGITYNSIFSVYGGKISGNTASNNGGGVWVTDINDVTEFENFSIEMGRLMVSKGVLFEKNRAGGGLYPLEADKAHLELYNALISSTQWTYGFECGYNNFDIGYTFGYLLGHYWVIYDEGEGEGAPASKIYDAGVIVTVSEREPSRVGYTFRGWLYNGELGLGGDLFEMPASDVTLVAQWCADVGYVVHYYLWETEFSIASDKIVGPGYNLGDLVIETPIEISGYSMVDPRPVSGVLGALGNVFVFYYVAVPVSTTWYVVHYYLEGTTDRVAMDKVVVGQIGDDVMVEAVEVSGYSVVEPSILEGTLNATSNVFTFYYVVMDEPDPLVEYVVHYYLEGTTDRVAMDKVVVGQVLCSVVTEEAVVVSGFVAVEPTSLTLALDASGTEFIFYYRVDEPEIVFYTVFYYLQGSSTSVADSKVGMGVVGAEVTEVAISVFYHTAIVPTSVTITLGVLGNEIIFFYTKDAVPTETPNSSSSSCYSKSKSSPAPSASVDPTNDTEPTTLVVPPEKTVLAWTLLNSVISIIGVILSIALTVFVLLWRNKEQKKKNQR